MRRAFAVATIVLGVGCVSSPDTPVSFVAGLRVLAVRAEPPQVDPGAVSQLTVLAVDTNGGVVAVTWGRCLLAPRPGEAVNPGCVVVDAAGATPTVEPLGGGTSIMVQMPAVTAGELGQPDATNGVYLPVVARVTSGAEEVTTVYRLRLGDGMPPNANPMIASVDVINAAGTAMLLDEATPLVVHAGDELTLSVTFPPGSAQMYVGFGGAQLTETLTTSWFCTAGDFSVDRTSDTQPHTVLRLTDRLPAAGKIIDLWAVAHDERGGVGYTHRVLELQ